MRTKMPNLGIALPMEAERKLREEQERWQCTQRQLGKMRAFGVRYGIPLSWLRQKGEVW